MALREKPKREIVTDTEALEYINRGGSSAGEVRPSRSQPVNLKIPRPMLRRIDKAVSNRNQKLEIPIPRTQWIMEAIEAHLKKEKC